MTEIGCHFLIFLKSQNILDANVNKTQITYVNAYAISTLIGGAIKLTAIN